MKKRAFYRNRLKPLVLKYPEKMSAKEIVDELNGKYPTQAATLNPKTIYRWRQEERDRIRLKRLTDPLIAKRREEHFNHLAEIAATLLSNGIDTVEDCRTYESRQESGLVYTITDGDLTWDMTEDELVSRLIDNLATVHSEYGQFDYDSLIMHLLAHITELFDQGMEYLIAHEPYKLIETLRPLARKRIFAGYCDACPDRD